MTDQDDINNPTDIKSSLNDEMLVFLKDLGEHIWHSPSCALENGALEGCTCGAHDLEDRAHKLMLRIIDSKKG